jgi:hypothetical protein
LIPVEKRDAATLIPIIQRWIKIGSTIISDEWKAYSSLSRLGYNHLTVNHSKSFKNPNNGAHTNSMEGTWRHAKSAFPEYRRKKEYSAGYLAKYLFRKSYRRAGKDPIEAFFEYIA